MAPEGYDFAGKVAVVTGGGTGIGAATALLLARYGADVAIAGRTEATLSQSAEAIERETGRRCLRIKADVSMETEVEAMVARVVAELGRVDVLVNGVGWGDHVKLSDTDLAAWRHEFARNLDTGFLCTRAVGPYMRAQRSGAIVNVSSVAGSGGVQGLAAYSVAKAGIQMFTRVAAAEWGQHGIRINCVAPGLIATDNAMKDFVANNLDVDRFCANYPLQRAGRAEDVARAIVFFASDASSYITGETLTVAGGPIVGGSGG
ncbi:MAG: SDR family oxidoreductase [Sphingomonadales bacterium]|nr:SDR family oxidoreductase [Sphingomonadales bacterium]